MSSILRSTLGRAATIVAVAALAVAAFGATAEAGPYQGRWDRGWHDGWHHGWNQPHRWDHARWYRDGYYAPRYYAPRYYAPQPLYPPAYYGPPSLNFTIPLG